MDMDHLIGQRFNLISKSEIRYIGTLHEINPEQSTIALENVYSFGTEDRKAEKFVPPSQQKYGFIVFRGSDVKDIKIAEEEQPQPSPPPSMPNDPAILNASQPGPPLGGPPRDHFSPPGYPPHPQFGGYFPPGQFGRGYGPPPGGFGPGPGFSPYGPPPPGYFGPPGPGFPQGHGPQSFPPPPAPIGPPGQRHNGPPPPPLQPQQTPSSRPSAPAATNNQTSELPVDNKGPQSAFPAPPKEAAPQSKPTIAEIAARAPVQPTTEAAPSKIAPRGPKTNKVTPAVPFTVNQKSFNPPVAPAADVPSADGASAKHNKPAPSQAAMDEAARQAKEAVAAAMAKLNPQAGAAQNKAAPQAAAVDALTMKVAEMSTSAPTNGSVRGGRGSFRGERGGNYGRGRGAKKIDIPKSDFDFESSNAKFNKEDLIKEAIATGSPSVAGAEEDASAEPADGDAANATPQRKDSLSTGVSAYNRSTSFFDNISSEAKDREGGVDGRAHARQVRSDEFRKNIETFGQGNVDGGYRGRGRGGYGRGRPYGGTYRGGNRGYGYRGGRGRNGQDQVQTTAGQTAAQS